MPADSTKKGFLSGFTYLLQDAADYLRGHRDPLIPPRRLIDGGPPHSDDFKAYATKFFHYYVDLAELGPSEAMLDLGCGPARKTIPMLNYLNESGSYEGLDLNREAIRWCRRMIGTKYPNFRFQWVNMYNPRQNPDGLFSATEFRLPFEDGQFDFVAVISFFTMMAAEEVENFLGEVSRVLKPQGGRCLISFYLLNQETQRRIEAGESALTFRYGWGRYRLNDADRPENAVGYDEEFILNLYRRCGLTIRQPIYYGAWSGRPDHLNYQDLILADKSK